MMNLSSMAQAMDKLSKAQTESMKEATKRFKKLEENMYKTWETERSKWSPETEWNERYKEPLWTTNNKIPFKEVSVSESVPKEFKVTQPMTPLEWLFSKVDDMCALAVA